METGITIGVIGFLLGFICSTSLATHYVDKALDIMELMIATADKASKALSEVMNEKTI
jgi:hypothetical protein